MKIMLNGEAEETGAETLAQVLIAFGFGGAKVATALNGNFVAAINREAAELQEGDRLEILAPMQGG